MQARPVRTGHQPERLPRRHRSRRMWSILRQRWATNPTTSTAAPTGRRWRSRSCVSFPDNLRGVILDGVLRRRCPSARPSTQRGPPTLRWCSFRSLKRWIRKSDRHMGVFRPQERRCRLRSWIGINLALTCYTSVTCRAPYRRVNFGDEGPPQPDRIIEPTGGPGPAGGERMARTQHRPRLQGSGAHPQMVPAQEKNNTGGF